MTKIFIAWAIDPLENDSVINCGEFSTVDAAIAEVNFRGLTLAEVETEHRISPTIRSTAPAAVNQTCTIRRSSCTPVIEGATIVKVSTTGSVATVACDSGVIKFHRSPRNGIYYMQNNDSLRLVF